MARIYKFSFPLPGRKSSAEKQPVAESRLIDDHNADDSPMFNPGEKARRLLGTSEPDRPELKQKQSWRARIQAKKYPSFMSIMKQGPDDGSARDYEETVMPERMTPHKTVGPPAHTLRNQPSSPLLGQHFMDDAVTWGSVTTVSNSKAHYSESSTTLQCYYDPLKSPLAISQQTSASSARDMALRKGCKPIASPPRHGASGTMPYPAVSDGDHMYNHMDVSKRRPPQLDVSTLFPKPRTSQIAAPLPSTIVKSPSQMSLASTSQRWVSLKRPSGTAQDGTKGVDDEVGLKDILRMDEHHIKPKVKRPKKAAKNLFDGLGEEDNESINIFPQDNLVRALPKDPRETVKFGLDEVSKDLRLRQRKSSMSDPHRRPLTSRRTLSFRLDPAAHATTACTKESLQSSGLTSAASSVSRRSRRSAQVNRISISGMDLVNQSVLVLSSSDDEIEQSSPRRRASIRDSIEVADISDEPLVYSADTIKASKPRPVVRVLPGKASNSTMPADIPPVPKMPETPQLHQRASSKKFDIKSKITSMKVVDDTNIKHKLASMEILDDPNSGAGASVASRTSAKVHRSATHTIDYARGSKMMAVTEEEEKLLEAMRKKRASIRKLDFAEGFHEALQLHGNIEPPIRPKTASVDGRSAFVDPDRTTRTPPLGQGLRNSLTGAPFAASTDDLTQVDSPENTQRWSRNTSSITPSDPSPSLSFSPSDILPSPPSSCLSPRTPPPGLGFLEVTAGGVGPAPSRQLRLWDTTGHNRKQSVSSGGLTLSSGGRKARDIDSEDGSTGWAMERW